MWYVFITIWSLSHLSSYLIKAQPKVFTLEDDVEDDDGNNYEDDDIPPSSPNISESSDSDVVIQRRKKRWTQPPASATVAVLGKAHVRGKNGVTWTTCPVSNKWSWKVIINKSIGRAVKNICSEVIMRQKYRSSVLESEYTRNLMINKN